MICAPTPRENCHQDPSPRRSKAERGGVGRPLGRETRVVRRMSCGSLAGSGVEEQVWDLSSCFQSAGSRRLKGRVHRSSRYHPGVSGGPVAWGEVLRRRTQRTGPHGERSEERGRAPELSPSTVETSPPLAPGLAPVQSSHIEASPLPGLNQNSCLGAWAAPPTPQHLAG